MEKLVYGNVNNGEVGGVTTGSILDDLEYMKNLAPVSGSWKLKLYNLLKPIMVLSPLAAWGAFVWGGIDPSMAAYAIAGLGTFDCAFALFYATQIKKYLKQVDSAVEKIENINKRMLEFMGQLAKNNVHVNNFNLVPVVSFVDKTDSEHQLVGGEGCARSSIGERKGVLAVVSHGEVKAWLLAVSNYYQVLENDDVLACSPNHQDEVKLFLLDEDGKNMLSDGVNDKMLDFETTGVIDYEEHSCTIIGGVRQRVLGRKVR